MFAVVFASLLSVALAGVVTYPDQNKPMPPVPVLPPTPEAYNPTVPTYNPSVPAPNPSPPAYNPSVPAQAYNPPAPSGSYGGGGYDQQTCKTYYETIQVDKCERYNEKVCYTTQEEKCDDVPDQNCNGIVTSYQTRQCFNVTELKCRLQEAIQYETVQAVFTVQKCHTVTERVCDTVYETEETNKDDFQCISVRNSICNNADQTLYDKTCRTTTKFDCNYNDYNAGYGSGGSGGNAAAGYGSNYDENKDYCKRTYNTQCYNTPRVVNYEVCVPQDQQICDKLVNTAPIPKEKQVCRNDEKKVCELEQRSQPKQIKKYVYTTNCKSVPRQVCDNSQTKKLVPSCVQINRKTCKYNPVEKCEDVPKDYCYKVPKKIAKQKCYSKGYEADNSDDATATYES